MTAPVAAALVHHPVLDGRGAEMTAAITNIDVHDIARTCRTFDLAHLYIVTPITVQRELVNAIRAHWLQGAGGRRIPARKLALERVVVTPSLASAQAHWAALLLRGAASERDHAMPRNPGATSQEAAAQQEQEQNAGHKGTLPEEPTAEVGSGAKPSSKPASAMMRTWATAARSTDRPLLTFSQARALLDAPEASATLLVFGTAHGLAPAALDACDALLEPVVGAGDFNHLSVRAAAAIIIDRLLAPRG